VEHDHFEGGLFKSSLHRRNGQVVLRDFPQVLHICVQASLDVCARNLMKRMKTTHDVAEGLIRDSDRQRERYIKRFYNVARDDLSLYHLEIN
jgi:cytidylate kinase